MYVCMYVCMYARVVGWPHRVITGGDDQRARGEGSAQRALFGANRALYRGEPCRPSRPGGASPLGCVVRTAHGPRRDPRAGAPSAFAPRTARCPLAADPGCNLPGQRSFLARWQMVAKPARRRSPRRHQQRRRRRSSSHSASRAVRLPHAAPIGLLHCTSGATMCTCSSMPMPRVPCADALDEPAHVPQMPSVQVTVGSPEAERRGQGVAPTAHGGRLCALLPWRSAAARSGV